MTDLSHQLLLHLQLLIQLILSLLEGDTAAALGVFDPDPPVVDLLQEVVGAQLVFNEQHSGSVEPNTIMVHSQSKINSRRVT